MWGVKVWKPLGIAFSLDGMNPPFGLEDEVRNWPTAGTYRDQSLLPVRRAGQRPLKGAEFRKIWSHLLLVPPPGPRSPPAALPVAAAVRVRPWARGRGGRCRNAWAPSNAH